MTSRSVLLMSDQGALEPKQPMPRSAPPWCLVRKLGRPSASMQTGPRQGSTSTHSSAPSTTMATLAGSFGSL
eukprot:CAMPEP_0175458432 /NCGR_PEP_ID=MMETSP0095-20121207/66581_1 /TAXON_ID=311494 /ORGANISM="Alexandrium monilatum, Strain CCMP3105" /LENGTH=71 /DNA_ID=CAMNT_0016759333 /DNA_START=4 /DNA_END=216 /DNA_ORIENTATION=+